MSAIAVFLWLLLLVLPGLAIARLLRVPGSLGALVAIAAPISFGYIYLIGVAASRFGLPVLDVCLAAVGALLICWLIIEGLRFRAAGSSPTRAGAAWLAGLRVPSVACSRALLVVGIGLGLFLWRALHSDLNAPAGWDAMHLGFFTRQIVDHETLEASVVQSSDPGLADSTSSFYPLGLNLFAALLHVTSGIRISSLLLASMIALAGVILPLGVYYLARRVAPGQPLVAGFGAVASVMPVNLFTIEYYGRITAIAGLALVPASVCALLCLSARVNWRLVVPGCLTTIGLIGVHTSELIIVVAVTLLIVLVDILRTRMWRARFLWLLYLGGIGVLSVALLLVADPGVRHMLGERSGAFIAPNGGTLPVHIAIKAFALTNVRWVPGDNALHAWSVTALAGCVLTLHPRWWRLAGPSLAYLGYGALWIAWSSGHVGHFAFLADAWYRDTARIGWELSVLGAIPVGIALASVATLIIRAAELAHTALRRSTTSGRTLRWTAALAGTAVALLGFASYASPPARAESAWLRTQASPVNANSRAAFVYLAAHVRKGDRVLDDLEAHGDMWMFVDYDVRMLFGNPPLIGSAPASWKERLYLRGELRHIATNSCVEHLLKKYRVSYVYYSTRHLDDAHLHLSLRVLRNRKYFQTVFTSGGARVFKVEPQASVAPCSMDLTLTYPWSTLHNAK